MRPRDVRGEHDEPEGRDVKLPSMEELDRLRWFEYVVTGVSCTIAVECRHVKDL